VIRVIRSLALSVDPRHPQVVTASAPAIDMPRQFAPVLRENLQKVVLKKSAQAEFKDFEGHELEVLVRRFEQLLWRCGAAGIPGFAEAPGHVRRIVALLHSLLHWLSRTTAIRPLV